MEPIIKTSQRIVALLCLCLVGFGASFCYANPFALFAIFEWPFSAYNVKLIYLVQVAPNLVLNLVGGRLTDRWLGLPHSFAAYTCLMVVGQLLCVVDCVMSTFWLTLIGRLAFGIGFESMVVAQHVYTALWFKGKQLNTAFSSLFVARFLGILMNIFGMHPIVAEAFKLINLLATLVVCVVMLIATSILAQLDKRGQLTAQCLEDGRVTLKDFSSIKEFFGIASFSCVAFCFAIFPFIIFELSCMIDSNKEQIIFSGIIISISFLVAPCFGLLIDLVHWNVAWIFSASLITVVAHVLIGFTSFYPNFLQIVMGLAFSILGSGLWTLVTHAILGKYLGIAFGFCQSIQNLSFLIFFITMENFGVAGRRHLIMHYTFICLLSISIVLTIIFWIYNKTLEACLRLKQSSKDYNNLDSIRPSV